MAVTARKNEYVYAPSRVYSHSKAATAEALPNHKTPNEAPRVKPAQKKVRKQSEAHSRTRVQRIGAAEAKKRKIYSLYKFVSVVLVFALAAVVILMLSRYTSISGAYTEINKLKSEITTKEQSIATLKVQLNGAISLEEARDEAVSSGLNYPTGEQIVKIRRASPTSANADDTVGTNATQ